VVDLVVPVEMVVAETDLQLLVDLQHNLDNLEFLDHLVLVMQEDLNLQQHNLIMVAAVAAVVPEVLAHLLQVMEMEHLEDLEKMYHL
jgi:hypothetical protein